MTGQEEQAASTSGPAGETFLVSTNPASPDTFNRTITLGGNPMAVRQRAVVLVFDATNWNTPQAVYVFAYDDTRPEGERVAIAAQSVISKDTHFDHATVRNVEVDVIDNDKADVVVTELDPNTTQPDGNTIVLEGTATTQVTDIYDVQLAKAPVDSTGSVMVTIAPSNNRLCLTSSDAIRFHAADGSCPVLGTTYTVTFTQANWNAPVRITVRARNDFVTEDPQSTTLLHTVTLTNDADYNAAKAFISARINALSIDDETPGVFLLESNGRTLVVACGNPPTCTTPGTGDSYTVRLTKAPTAPVTIAVVTDGQTDVTLGGRVTLDLVGGARPQQLFTGNIKVTGAVVTRGDGADLGSFIDDGFAVGQRIRITGTGTPIDTTIAAISLACIHVDDARQRQRRGHRQLDDQPARRPRNLRGNVHRR